MSLLVTINSKLNHWCLFSFFQNKPRRFWWTVRQLISSKTISLTCSIRSNAAKNGTDFTAQDRMLCKPDQEYLDFESTHFIYRHLFVNLLYRFRVIQPSILLCLQNGDNNPCSMRSWRLNLVMFTKHSEVLQFRQ